MSRASAAARSARATTSRPVPGATSEEAPFTAAMSKILDRLKQAERQFPRGESPTKPAESRFRAAEDAIEAVAELRNRVEAERSAEEALQARSAEERRGVALARDRRAAGAE